MAKYQAKTKQTAASVPAFLNTVEPAEKRADARTIDALMRKVTGVKPKMWGTSMVGYGSYHYKYATGHEGDAMMVGFSPRKQNLTVYIMPGFSGYEALLARLGKHSTGKSCLYVNRLSDIDMTVLEKLVARSVDAMKQLYNAGA